MAVKKKETGIKADMKILIQKNIRRENKNKKVNIPELYYIVRSVIYRLVLSITDISRLTRMVNECVTARVIDTVYDVRGYGPKMPSQYKMAHKTDRLQVAKRRASGPAIMSLFRSPCVRYTTHKTTNCT
jgi:hypothetical protein